MANYCEERTPSISAIGEALVALEKEYLDLEYDVQRLFAKAGLAMQKQKICVDAIKQILAKANGGEYPPAVKHQHFSGLS